MGAAVTDLAAEHNVSRKFVHQQADNASAALIEVFSSSAPDDEVLFELPNTKTWLRQLTLGFTLIGHGSYRGIAMPPLGAFTCSMLPSKV